MIKQLSSLALISLTILACSTSPERQMQQQFSKGLDQIDQFAFAEAESTFADLSVDFPDVPLGRLGIGLTKERQGLHLEALERYLSIERDVPEFDSVYVHLGRVYAKLNEPALAASAWTQFVSRQPADSRAKLERARQFIADFRPIIARQGFLISDPGDLDRAAILQLTAQSYFLEGHADSALRTDASATGTAGDNAHPYFLLTRADWHQSRQQYDSALIYSQRFLASDAAGQEERYAEFKRYLAMGYYSAAEEMIPSLSGGQDAENAVAAHLWQFLAWARNDNFRADRATAEMILHTGTNIDTYFAEIESRLRLNDKLTLKDNVQLINALMARRESDTTYIHYVRGRMILTFGEAMKPEIDIMSLRSAPGWQQDDRRYRLQEIYDLAFSQQFELMQSRLDLAEQQHPTDIDWLAGLGELHLRPAMLSLDSASEYFRRALQRNDVFFPALNGMITTKLADGPQAALSYINSLGGRIDRVPQLGTTRARLLIALDSIDAGLDQFGRAIAPMSALLAEYEATAEALRRRLRHERVGEVFTLMVANNPGNPEAFQLAAGDAGDRGDWEAARNYVDAGLEVQADHFGLAVEAARVRFHEGNRPAARAALDSLLAIATGDVNANRYAAYAYAADSTDFVRAGNLVRSAIRSSPHDLKTLLTACEVFSLNGAWQQVINYAGQAANLYVGVPEPLYYLGQALYHQGDDQAQPTLEMSLQLGLRGDERTTAVSLLRQLDG